MKSIRKAEDRGSANFGWLDSKHTFSFGSYYDEKHMGFSALRVINDDTVAPGAGFDTHGHRDMEIISLVTKGVIEHKDSMGNIQRLPEGEFQLMSAGKGVYHSEYNASKEEELKFLQIWIVPNEQGGKPGYQQKRFGTEQGITDIITPSGEHGTLKIKQDMQLKQLILAPGTSIEYVMGDSRKLFVHQVEGTVSIVNDIDGAELTSGDGISIEYHSKVLFSNESESPIKALLFDLP